MKRTPMKRKRSTKLEFSDGTKTQITKRASSRCEVASNQCRGGIHHFHHRRLRSQGGKGDEVNGLAACSPCHNLIHANPDWAYRHGLLVRASRDPAFITAYQGCSVHCAEDHVGQ